MIKRFMLIACIFLAGWSLAIAQGGDRGIQNDPAAKELLDNVSKQFQSFNSLESEFTITIFSPEDDLNEVSQGKVLLKGDKYRIAMNDVTIICDNVKRWIYLKESNEVQITYYEPDGDNIESPSQLFTIYKDNFYYRSNGEDKATGKLLKVIDLIPTKLGDSPYRKITLYVDPVENIIKKAIIDSKDGIIYTWSIKTFKPGVNLPDATFTFDPSKHPNVRIDDMTK